MEEKENSRLLTLQYGISWNRKQIDVRNVNMRTCKMVEEDDRNVLVGTQGLRSSARHDDVSVSKIL